MLRCRRKVDVLFAIAVAVVCLPSCKSLPAQRFAIEPVDKSAIVNDTILLACRVVNKVGTIQWTRDSFGLGTDRDLVGYPRYTMSGNDEEGDYSLQIRDVNLEDDARFQCQVGAVEGAKGIRSRVVTLTVHVPPDPPSIVEGEYLKTTAGTEVVLTCEALNGKPAAELTWVDQENNPVPAEQVTYSTQLLSDAKRANAFLKWTFVASKEHDGKTFTCRSENPALKKPQKANIKLEVKYPPAVKLIMDREHVLEGEDVKFTCDASANPGQVIYKWYRNDEVVLGDHATSYIMRKVSRDENGAKITCEVSNAVGVAKASHVLNLSFGPVLRSPLQEVYGVLLGQEVKLKCDVAGNPAPEIIWLFEGSPRVLSTESELIIPEMNYDLAGKYLCRASVRGFPEISTSTQVFIKGPPRVTASPIQYGSEGEAVRIECLIQSVPPPIRVSWTRNAKIIDTSTGYEQVEEKLETASLIRNSLLIHNPRREDFGVYNCSAENDFGTDHVMVSLAKQKSYPMLMIVTGVIVSVLLVVSLAITAILCFKKKSVDATDYMSDMKNSEIRKVTGGPASMSPSQQHHHHLHHHYQHQAVDTGSSGADSDVKVEIRTSSSLSDRHGWVDGGGHASERTVTADEIAQVVENIYNYSQQQQQDPLYSSTNKIDSSLANNNATNGNSTGYVPYADYSNSREYLPPSNNSHILHHHQYQQQLHMEPLAMPQHASIVVTSSRDSYGGDPYASLPSPAALVDPRYSRSFMTSPAYIRSPVSGLTYASNLNATQMQAYPSHGTQTGTSGHSPSHHHHSHHTYHHHHSQQQVSPLLNPVSATYATGQPPGSSNLQMYITSSSGNGQPVKQTTLATHV